ncbi:bifunctional hydroxymethylpyrimidine kinase/phosphomethylpyrimidine kinase [Nocardioides sp. Bht2]|uniref:bifunctional hydroxymethylpyrimidine kinase/phosphomethylpyrimidine kinase n=1 Tax=Nocardioides sp. Bht2 TaxID=3392297 RepID=UPI0039B3D87C
MPPGPRSPATSASVGRRAVQLDSAADLELRPTPARLLAIGSLVAFGSVGLSATNRVFDAAGVPTAKVPTVLYPVMPHYPSARPLDVPSEWIATALADLTAAGALSELGLVTSGYLASADQAEAIAAWWLRFRSRRTSTFVLDPTLGDTGLGFYTEPGVADAIRDHLLPISHGITPNLFELAQLSQRSLDELGSLAAIEAAARSLFHRHTEWVVVTGIRAPSRAGEQGAEIGELIVIRSGFTFRRHSVRPTRVKGLGDLFAARLNLALLDGADIAAAVEMAARTVLARIPEGPQRT